MFINYPPPHNPTLILLGEKVTIYYPLVIAIGQTLGSFIISYLLTYFIQRKYKE